MMMPTRGLGSRRRLMRPLYAQSLPQNLRVQKPEDFLVSGFWGGYQIYLPEHTSDHFSLGERGMVQYGTAKSVKWGGLVDVKWGS